jgi:hypothetical protein
MLPVNAVGEPLDRKGHERFDGGTEEKCRGDKSRH